MEKSMDGIDCDERIKVALELIEPFEENQKKLIDIIKEYGGSMTTEQFDEEFMDCYLDRNPRGFWGLFLPIHSFGFEATFNDGLFNWTLWVRLTQEMVIACVIDIKGKMPNIEYCL